MFVESFDGTFGVLLIKPVLEKRHVSWITELSSVFKKFENSFYHSIKMTPIEAFTKINTFFLFLGQSEKRIQKYSLGDLVGTVDINRTFSK